MNTLKSRCISIFTLLLILFNTTPLHVNAETPQLNIYKHNNHYIKAEWANEMNDEHILYETGFEEDDELPRRTYNSSGNRQYGGQSFVTEDKFSGKRSLKVVDSYSNGNYTTRDFNGKIGYQEYSAAIFGDRKYMENGTDLSVSFRAKTTGRGHISLWGNGGKADFGVPMSQYFTEDVNPGDRTVKVNDVSYFKNRLDNGHYSYVSNQKGQYDYIHVTAVNEENSTLTFNSSFKGFFKKGDNLLQHQHRAPVTFNSRSFTSDEGWQLFNINTKVANLHNYNTLLRGFELWIRTTTGDTVYIDDLKLGYATRNRLYRDNQLLYDGMLSDYDDKGAVDKANPNKVDNINVSVGDGVSEFTYSKPADNGTEYNYRLEAIINNEIFPTYESLSVISGIKGYSYIINTSPNSTPNGVINTSEQSFEIPKINSYDKHYLHIRSVDNQGNTSVVSRVPFDVYDVDKTSPEIEIIQSGTSTTHDDVILYVSAEDSQSAIKNVVLPDGEVVNSSNVEYRVKENGIYKFTTEDLAGNKAEKTYAVSNIDKSTDSDVSNAVNFGELIIKDDSYTAYAKLEDLFVQDWRDGANIWRVDVSSSQLVSIGGHRLPKGSLVMNPYKSINKNGDKVDNGNISNEVPIDNGVKTLIRSNGARGEHYISFSENSIGIVIDPTLIKEGLYKTKLSWDVKMAP